MRYFIYSLLFSLLIASCQEPKASSDSDVSKVTTKAATLPMLPESVINDLVVNCTAVDYTFYDLPFSMNQTNDNDIKHALSHIAAATADLQTDCKPMARIFYQAHGDIALQADLYFQGDCIYFKFLEGSTYKYANKMTPQGVSFYKNILANIQKNVSEQQAQ